MSPNIAHPRIRLYARRALYVALLLLPGTLLVLPLLWWLDRRAPIAWQDVFSRALSKCGPLRRHCPGGMSPPA